MRLHKFLLTMIAVGAFASVANADIVNIDLTADGPDGMILDANQMLTDGIDPFTPSNALADFPGLTLAIDGTTTAASGSFNGTNGTFGINSAGGDDSQRLDGDLSETVIFTFNQDVLITLIDFTSFGADSTAVITDSEGTVFNLTGAQNVEEFGRDVNGNGAIDNANPIVALAGVGVSIAAGSATPIPPDGRTSPDFGLEDIQIHVVVPDVAVPEPGSLAVLGLLGGVAAIRRRR